MLQDQKFPREPKELSLMTHPDASKKMYDRSKYMIFKHIL